MNRIILTAIIFLSAIVAFADEKMTIRNVDTGESFEVSVPDGTKISIQEYNSEWLDSIPYLMEHARQGEPWAYEALSDCHRYGKGGLKRSVLNALFYYELAGKNMGDYMVEIEQSNHNDPIAMYSRLVDYIDNKDSERIACAVDTLNKNGYHSADILLKFIDSSNRIGIEDVIEFATDKETDPDASAFACIGYALCSNNDSIRTDFSWAAPLIMGKIPFMYTMLGTAIYEKTMKSENSDGDTEDASPQDIEDRRKAVELFLKADEYAVLSKRAARLLHHYCTSDSTSEWVNLSEEDLCRIQHIAGV